MPHTHDHELLIGSTTDQFYLVKDDEGRAMYQVLEDIPDYQPNLRFTQFEWLGGHGQLIMQDGMKFLKGQSIDTTQHGKVFLGPLITEVKESDDTDLDAAPSIFLWFEGASGGSELLCATSGKIYRYDVSSNGKWTAATTTVAGVTDLIEYKGIAYAGIGSSSLWYYSTDGDSWTQTDLTNAQGEKLLSSANAAGTDNVLWSAKQPNELYSTTDGRTAAAGGVAPASAAYIGDTSDNITNVFLVNDNLMVGREDNLYHYDADGGVHPLMDDLKHNRDANNFKYVTQWQSGTYFSLGKGLGEITTYNTYEAMGPLTRIDDIGKDGTCVGLASDKDWLYVIMDEGTNTIVYKGREERRNDDLVWEWCPWVFLGTKTCATAKVVQHSATDRRLWFGYTNSTAYVILSDDPLADSAARFAASGSLEMSYTYGSNPNFDKLWQSTVIEQTRYASGAETAASSGETVQVKYKDDRDTSSTECVAAYNTAGVVETNFTSAINNKRISFELHLASDTNTATPAVSYFQAKGVEVPTTVRIHEAFYRIGDKRSDRAKTIRSLLRDGRTSTSLIKFADLRYGEKTSGTSSGDYVWCVMMPGYPKEVEVKHEKGRQPETAIQVRLQEVSFTIS